MLSRPNNDLTGRCGGRQRLFGDCTFKFDVESISVCDGGAPIHVAKVTVDHIEVAVHQDDSSMPNTKQPESSWHRVSAASCQL